MNYHIRPVRMEDVEQINAIRILPEVGRNLLALPTEQMTYTASYLENSGSTEHLFVAVDSENHVLGMGNLHVEALPRYDHKGSLGLMVAPHAQGKGIGRALMNTLIDLADNWLLLDRLELTVFARNQRAIALYHSLGFEDEATTRRSCVREGSIQDEIDMARLRPGFVPLTPQLPADVLPSADKKPPLPCTIRPVQKEDCPAIARIEIAQGVYESTVSLPSARAVHFDAWYENLNPFYDHALVAEGILPTGNSASLPVGNSVSLPTGNSVSPPGEDNTALLGLCNLHLSPNPRQRHRGDIGIMLAPQAQSRGVGRKLMQAMIDVAEGYMALTRLELVVFAHNHRAIALYRSLGFREEGRYVASAKGAGGHYDEITMARQGPAPVPENPPEC